MQLRDCSSYPFLASFAIHMNQKLHNLCIQNPINKKKRQKINKNKIKDVILTDIALDTGACSLKQPPNISVTLRRSQIKV